jgi:hypothetical protein
VWVWVCGVVVWVWSGVVEWCGDSVVVWCCGGGGASNHLGLNRPKEGLRGLSYYLLT